MTDPLTRTITSLRWLPPAYLRLHLELPQQRTNPADRVHTTRTPPLPCSLDMLSLLNRGGIVLPLATWEDDWREIRGYTRAPFRGSTEQTLRGVVDFLANHAPWAEANHPAWDEFRSEVAWLRRTVERVLDEDERRYIRTRIPCPDCDTHPAMAVDTDIGAIVCPTCGSAWYAEAWDILAEHVVAPVRVHDAATMTGTPERTVRTWVARGEIPNHGDHGHVRVLLADVMRRARDTRNTLAG